MIFKIKIGMNGEVSQQQITEILSREKIEFIQTSDGLCLKADREKAEKTIAELNSNLTLEEVKAQAEFPPDVLAFINS